MAASSVPLPLGEIDRALHLECEPLAEGPQDLGRREHDSRAATSSTLAEPVEPSADLADGGERVFLQEHAARCGELDEERRASSID